MSGLAVSTSRGMKRSKKRGMSIGGRKKAEGGEGRPGTHEGEVVLVEVLLVSSSGERNVLEVGERLLVLLSGKEEGD